MSSQQVLLASVVWLLLVCLPTLTKAQLNAGDAAALRALQSRLHDVPDSSEPFFATWDFSSDPCSFVGVLCDMVGGEERVTSLSLGLASGGSKGLHGRLHPAVGNLSDLVQLILAPGKVGGSIPEALAQLPRLSKLGLSHNLLTGPIPPLPNLTTLDLSFNRLSGILPATVASISTLQVLSLDHNRLTGTLPTFLTPRLTHIDIKRNTLTGLLPALPASLTYISLFRNELAGPISNTAMLTGLTFLDLSQNQFTGGVPPELFSAPLAYLLLRRNQLSGPISPPGLVRIPTVDLSFNNLSGEISPFLAFVENLYLNNNGFMGAVPQEFIDQLMSSSLLTLFVQYNFLTDFPLRPGTILPVSATLCIQHNCMMPNVQPPCPQSAGRELCRPSSECKTV